MSGHARECWRHECQSVHPRPHRESHFVEACAHLVLLLLKAGVLKLDLRLVLHNNTNTIYYMTSTNAEVITLGAAVTVATFDISMPQPA